MGKKKILVVDDEIDFLKMIKMRLEDNYEIITASDGKEAMDKVKHERLNAVLLDIFMPGMNGLEVLKKIRKHNEYLPVFIITAYPDKKCFDAAEKFNASGFLSKTADLKEEIERIKAVLNVAAKYKAE